MPNCLECGGEIVATGRRGRPRKMCKDCAPSGSDRLCADCHEPVTGSRAKRCQRCYGLSRRFYDSDNQCKIDGCEEKIGRWGKKGMCNKHYLRMRAGRDLFSERPKKPIRPPRLCADCGKELPSRRYKRCNFCLEALQRPPRICPECGAEHLGRIYCSRACARHHERATRRARRRDVEVERIFRIQIYERDRWTCQLCGKPVDRKAVAPGGEASGRRASLYAPTLDHIIPESLGGPHVARNVQTAHFICNSIKGAKATGEQLLLVG